jgi:hypothetical protein
MLTLISPAYEHLGGAREPHRFPCPFASACGMSLVMPDTIVTESKRSLEETVRLL